MKWAWCYVINNWRYAARAASSQLQSGTILGKHAHISEFGFFLSLITCLVAGRLPHLAVTDTV